MQKPLQEEKKIGGRQKAVVVEGAVARTQAD
jgi:hypothetical protein